MDAWIAEMRANAAEFSKADMTVAVDEANSMVSFAQAAATEESSSNYGYGFVAAGLVAAGVFLYS